jgi:50S ribosomal protein L4
MKRSLQRFFSTSTSVLPANVSLDLASQNFLENQALREAALKQALTFASNTPQSLRLPVLQFAVQSKVTSKQDSSSSPSSSTSSSTLSPSSTVTKTESTIPVQDNIKQQDQQGTNIETRTRFVDLDPVVFTTEIRRDIIHRVVVWQEQKARRTLYKAKTRSEVRGGGIKPWKQKGLGKARASSIRSPLWVGGGVAHPPKLRHWGTLLQVKVRRLGMRIALAAKFRDNRLLIVDKLAINKIKDEIASSSSTTTTDKTTSPTTSTTTSSSSGLSSSSSSSRTKYAIASIERLGIPSGSRILFVDDGSSSLSCRHLDTSCGCDVTEDDDNDDDKENSKMIQKQHQHHHLDNGSVKNVNLEQRKEELIFFRSAIANIPKTKILPHIGANVRDIVSADYVIFEEEALLRVVERVRL